MAMVSSLSDLPLFAGLHPAECAAIERRKQRRDSAPQSIIVREGAERNTAFVILSGSVAVRRKDADSGVEFLPAELGPGRMFGDTEDPIETTCPA